MILTSNIFFRTLKKGFTQIAFPNVCVCCGQEAMHKKHHICPFCLEKRFEYAGVEHKASTSNVILPHNVSMQYALWTFDKGGMLQNLMHNLKYERLTGIGYQLGKVLARRVQTHPVVTSALSSKELLLVPVPLHYLKFRKRGFNQAYAIARGIREVLSVSVCSIKAVTRTKYTQTQTGFSLEKRIQNMQQAFSVPQPKTIKNRVCIIIDDVFTTGSTSFELAKTLTEAGASSVMIWTIAQA